MSWILTDDADASRMDLCIGRYDIEAKVIAYDGLVSISAKISSFHEILADHYDDPESAFCRSAVACDLTQQPLLLFTMRLTNGFIGGVSAGVEECVAKPIGIPLFVAKTQRPGCARVSQQDGFQAHIGHNGFVLDPESRVLEGADAAVKLSNLECRLMAVFMATIAARSSKRVMLTRRVWSMYGDPDPKMLKT
ncbi:MAG: hypothetical protein R2851_20155 [Caldilineaceae bacterium]